MLIKKTRSLCPTCNSVVEAEIIEEEGKVWLKRTCPTHGNSKHLYWSDAPMYHRFQEYEAIGNGIANPQNAAAPPDSCPTACGLCSNHHSQTLLANIDLTNRCNLDCDFCFANARACGFVYEPSFDEVVLMLQVLRDEKPVPTPAVQFSGGEPTMREDLADIIRKAKAMGFPQVQIATNGVKIAKNPALAQELKSAGLNTIYLHFDGVSPATNPFLAIHKKALENLKKVGLGTVLVPTVIKGRNDQELGDIIRFAIENIAVVRGINFQPVAFTGAASDEDLQKSRITIPDVLAEIEKQMGGVLKKDDFYPVPCVLPFSDLVEAYTGRPQVRFTAHQHCGAATYVFAREDGIIPVNRMVDVDSFFESIEQMAETLKKGGTINKYKALLEGVKNMHGSVQKGEQGATTEFWKLISKSLIGQNFDALREFHWNALFIGTMHFMDKYNYDLERVQRCCIHYATPDGKLIPFCTYNTGPVYREQVWKKYEKKPEE
jgi:7,8-dihydro-6-hydroxymethylpterin dimethyltransferase